RPGKAFFLEPFLPKTKAVAVPIKNLDAAALTVHEHEQRIAKHIQRQLALHQGSQPVDLLAKVHRHTAQVDLSDHSTRMHQRPCSARAWRTCANHCGLGKPGNSSRRPSPSVST